MNIFEAILTRRSWRTFNGLRLDDTAVETVENIIRQVNDTDLTVRLRLPSEPRPRVVLLEDDSLNGLSGTYGTIRGARHFMALVAAPSDGAQIEAGVMLERIIIRLTLIGLDTCWLGGTFSRSRFASAATPADGEDIVAVTPVGHRSPSTRFAERMMQRLVRSARRKPFADLFTGVTPPDLSSLSNPSRQASRKEKVAILLDMVRHAPSSRNSQPWRADVSPDATKVHVRSVLHSRYTPVDMGIALAHFMEAAGALGMEWEITEAKSAPEISMLLTLK